MRYRDAFFVFGLVVVLALSGISAAFVAYGETTEEETSASASIIEEPFEDIDDSLDEYPFPSEYPSVNQLYDWYDDLVTQYPNLVEKHHYGTSYEERDLWALEITSNESTVVEEKPSVLIDGGIHAREWSGPQVTSYYMWRIVDEYDSNQTINWLVNNRRIFVVPMTNPDGYIYDGDGDLSASQEWRKNRNESTPTDAVGVDLNRNWDIAWEDGDDDPSSDTYHGEAPFSEYETHQLKDFMMDNDVDSYHNIHSYAGTLLIPNMYTGDPSPHDDWYRGMADHMTSLTSIMGDETQDYSYGQPDEEIGYSAPGGAADWAYHDMGAQGVTFELATAGDGERGGFYPPEEDIMTINQDVDDSLIYQTRVADTDLGDGENLLYPPVPYLVYGEVEDDMGDPVTDVQVEVESQVTGENLNITTDSNGYYEFNFGNLVEDGYDVGDDFTVGVDQDPESQVDFTVDDTWGRKIDLQYVQDTYVQTIEASQVTTGSAELTGSVTLGEVNNVDAYFEYRISGDPDWQSTPAQQVDVDGEYTEVVDGLESNTTYEFRAAIEWDGGSQEDLGQTLQFTTEEQTLEPPLDLRIEKDEAEGDLIPKWADVGASEYHLYYSENRYAEFSTWQQLATVSDTQYTHEGALGGENYYLVRSSDGSVESDNSTLAFCVEKYFGDERPRHYISVPMGFEDRNGDGELKASDLVMSIEGDLESSEYISDVVKWDYMDRGYSERYYYDTGSGGWTDDFVIEAGDGVGLSVEKEFTWHINGTDTSHSISLGDERPRHYVSIPYTLAEQTGDGELKASDLVTLIEGDLETSEFIYDVVKWDHMSRGYSERYYYDGLAGEWTDDFVIEPGDGIGFAVKNEFTLDLELITPVRGSTVGGLDFERPENMPAAAQIDVSYHSLPSITVKTHRCACPIVSKRKT